MTTKPAKLPLFGKPGFRDSATNLIKYGFALPATETEDTDEYVRRLSGDYADIRRINPPLRRAIQLDDVSPMAMRIMIEDTNVWLNSEEGKRTVEEIAQDLFKRSTRLKRRMEREKKP